MSASITSNKKLTHWRELFATVNEYVMVDDVTHSVEVNRRDLSLHGNVHLEEHNLPWGSAWRDSDECLLYRVIHSLHKELPTDDDVWYIAVIPQTIKKNNEYYTLRLFSRYPDTCKHCGQFMLKLLYPMNQALKLYKVYCSRQCNEYHENIVKKVMHGSVQEQIRIAQFKENARKDSLAFDGLLNAGCLFAPQTQHMQSYGSNSGEGLTSKMSGAVNILCPVSSMQNTGLHLSRFDNDRFLITSC